MPGFVERLSNGVKAFIAAYNEKALIPQIDSVWDRYESRLFRYLHSEHYYFNSVYTALANYASQHKSSSQLYKHVRGIYNPVQRLVNLYVAAIYGGAIDTENFESGAIPLGQASKELRAAIAQLYIWSKWGTQKSVFARQGCKMGDVFLKIVDDQENAQVRLEVLHPARVKELILNPAGDVKQVIIQYDVQENSTPSALSSIMTSNIYTYTEVIDEFEFVTYRNNEEYPFYTNSRGEPVSRWANEYGFVPLVHAKHQDEGMLFGATSYNGFLRKIDEINDAASLLNDQIRKVINPVWYMAGVGSAAELKADTTSRDSMPMIYGPAGSKPEPMVAPIDVAAASANIKDMLAELERDLPELAMHRIREQSQLTAPGVRMGYKDASDRVTEARSNYDSALVKAHEMAVRIGGYRKYEGFAGFSLESAERGDLAHFIEERPVFEDSLSEKEKIDALIAVQTPQEGIWDQLNIPNTTIDEWTKLRDEKAAQDEAALLTQIDRKSAQNQSPLNDKGPGAINTQGGQNGAANPASNNA